MSFEGIRSVTIESMEATRSEAQAVVLELVEPAWGSKQHGYPRTLYGYVLNAFSLIDLMSRYRNAVVPDAGQTDRMSALLVDIADCEATAARCAVQLWRHNLAHTGAPRALTDESKRVLRWLIHWTETHLPRQQHLTLVTDPRGERILNLCLESLLDDLIEGSQRIFSEIARDPDRRKSVERLETELGRARFSIP